MLAPNGVPEFAWCEVPAGTFRMGGDPEAYNAWDGADYDLPYTFWIAKYPVTYAQYEPFVTADGYREQRWWTDAGWEWKSDNTQPEYGWNDPQWHIASHPVVGVSWYEAYAYTQWLNALIPRILRPQREGEYTIRLARECEWEKAARCPDGRFFPWGNEWDPTRLNWGESGLGRTSAVDMFPTGANKAHGACDLIGNVWEWCLSAWTKDHPSPEVENNDPEGDGARCLRGGSFYTNRLFSLRAATRDRDSPDDGAYFRGLRVVLSVPI